MNIRSRPLKNHTPAKSCSSVKSSCGFMLGDGDLEPDLWKSGCAVPRPLAEDVLGFSRVWRKSWKGDQEETHYDTQVHTILARSDSALV